MEDFIEFLKTRRSIRRYTDEAVSDATLHTLMEAVRWSPSWANTQCWEIVIVRDPDTRAALQDTVYPKNPATKAIAAAPVLLVLCGKLNTSGYYNDMVTTKFGDWFMYDLGIATQTLCLTAHHMGLGTVIVGLFDHDRAARILGVPDGHEVVSMIPLGHPAKIGKAPERREIDTFVHRDRF